MIDSYTIISSMLKGFLSIPYLIPLLLLSFVLLALKPLIKGKVGEVSVAALLSTLPDEDYITLHDIMINSPNGTSQIDHIVISTHGVFVIETKNYGGWIFGKETDQYWTQTLGKEKHRFYNPIRQNYGHIMALEALLEPLGRIPFISIVTFSGGCELKTKPSGVVYYGRLLSEIKQHKNNVFSKSQINRIAGTISKANITEKDAQKQHVRNIRSRHK
ncbi:nuclease-related domain-containing protein [Oscillospiraceae bacterium PP1C4]